MPTYVLIITVTHDYYFINMYFSPKVFIINIGIGYCENVFQHYAHLCCIGFITWDPSFPGSPPPPELLNLFPVGFPIQWYLEIRKLLHTKVSFYEKICEDFFASFYERNTQHTKDTKQNSKFPHLWHRGQVRAPVTLPWEQQVQRRRRRREKCSCLNACISCQLLKHNLNVIFDWLNSIISYQCYHMMY